VIPLASLFSCLSNGREVTPDAVGILLWGPGSTRSRVQTRGRGAHAEIWVNAWRA